MTWCRYESPTLFYHYSPEIQTTTKELRFGLLGHVPRWRCLSKCWCVGMAGGDHLPMHPLSLVATCVAGWMNRHQQDLIEYLHEEVRILKAQLGKRPRFSDDQRQVFLRSDGDGFESLRSPQLHLSFNHRADVAPIIGLQRSRGSVCKGPKAVLLAR